MHGCNPSGIASKGFTVVELLVALTIVAILAGLGVPSFREFMNEQRLASSMSQLVNDLHFARTEAIKRNSRVLVCARLADSSACAASPDWKTGWMVCYDADSDDQCDTGGAAGPNPMKVGGGLHDSLQLAGTAAPLRFNPIGTSNGTTTLTLTGTWTGSTNRTATVATTGAVSSRKN